MTEISQSIPTTPDSTGQKRPFIQKRRFRLGVLMLGHLIVDMYAGLIAPLIVELQHRVDVKFSTMALLVGICHAAANVSQPLSGYFSPRFTRNQFLLWGPVLAMLLAFMGLSGSFTSLAIILIVAHLGIGAYHPEALVATHLVCEEHTHIGVPIFMSGGVLGCSVGALIGSQWYEHWGFDYFWLLALPGVVLLMLIKIAKLTSEKEISNSDINERSTDTEENTREFDCITEDCNIKKAPNFYLMMALAILTCTATTILFILLAQDIDVRWNGQGYLWSGRGIATVGLMSIFAAPLLGKLSSRISPFLIVALSQIVCIPIFIMLINSTTPRELIGWSIPAGMVMAVSVFPLIATQTGKCKELTAPLRAGLIIGGSWGIGALIASLCGKLTDYGISVHQVFTWTPLTMAAAAILAMWIYLKRRTI